MENKRQRIDDGSDCVRGNKKRQRKNERTTVQDLFNSSDDNEDLFNSSDNDSSSRHADGPDECLQPGPEPPSDVLPATSAELDTEAAWIYKRAFVLRGISRQACGPKPSSAIGKIKQALDFMRNQSMAVPYIAAHRQEYVQPELSTIDLWKVQRFDAKWRRLDKGRRLLHTNIDQMRDLQLETILAADAVQLRQLRADMRPVLDADMDRLGGLQSAEELRDVEAHFQLHYGHELPAMEAMCRRKEARSGRPPPAGIDAEPTTKVARGNGKYAMFRRARLLGFAQRVGLTPEQFAGNVRDNVRRHECVQETADLAAVAAEYVNASLYSVPKVLNAARYVVAKQLAAEPLLRRCVRKQYEQHATITVRLTEQGRTEIDANHPCSALKDLRAKPVGELTGDEYLGLSFAEEDKLLTIEMSDEIVWHGGTTYLEHVQRLYRRVDGEMTTAAQEWNAWRASCVEMAIKQMVLPALRAELKSRMLAEANEAVRQNLACWIGQMQLKKKG